MTRAIPTPRTPAARAVRWSPLVALRRLQRSSARLLNRLNGLTPAEVYAEDVDELLRPTFT
ncbi:MAG: hypothetical protein Q8M79_08595 [Dehalococcoidia bacterium]|nr:hypothetical protein [Dehalococcoidia bacterium]